jgi:hypothetical protein
VFQILVREGMREGFWCVLTCTRVRFRFALSSQRQWLTHTVVRVVLIWRRCKRCWYVLPRLPALPCSAQIEGWLLCHRSQEAQTKPKELVSFRAGQLNLSHNGTLRAGEWRSAVVSLIDWLVVDVGGWQVRRWWPTNGAAN